jgi:hypothetical protein
MSMIAAQGILLFLFIPLVLFLLLRQPAGPGWSVAIGLAIMFGHRFLAVPWMAKFADVRCLWCGRVGAGRTLAVVASGRKWQMTACSDSHAALLARFLGFLFRFRALIGLGIFLPLAWLVIASLASAAGWPLLPHATNALIFRVVVAATVVAASVAPFLLASSASPGGGSAVPEPPLRCPFPLHNLFLLGLRNVLWVFRLVGAWWLVDWIVRLVL